jgi:hypothetical protein
MDQPAAVRRDHGPQRHGRQQPGRPSQPGLVVWLAALLMLLAACTTNGSSVASDAPEDPPTGDAAEAASDPEPQPAPDPDPEADREPGRESADGKGSAEGQVSELWAAFHTAWVEQAGVDEPDPAAFEGLAADAQIAAEALRVQRGEARTITTDQELWPVVTLDGSDSATITDCAIVTQHPDANPDAPATITVAWEATATATDNGWRIQGARPTGLFCIAGELNDQLLDAYRDYRAAKNDAWDPPDPTHPALEATMTGEHLEFIRGLLDEHQAEGIVVRDPAPTDNAVVFELGIGTATVSDCAEQVPGRGAFDAATGDRLDELIPPVRDGQLDAQSVELVRDDDGDWKVTDQAGTRDTNCIQGSTRYAVR